MNKKIKDEFCKQIDFLIGKRIYQLRMEMGINSTDFSKSINVSKTQIYKYESGQDRVCMGRLILICRALNCSLNYFLDCFEDFHSPISPSMPYIKNIAKLDKEHLAIVNELVQSLLPKIKEEKNEKH